MNSGSLYVGGGDLAAGGTGTLSVETGATLDVGGTLKVWDGGTLNLTGGTITTDSFDLTLTGILNHTGGTLEVSGGPLNIDPAFGPGCCQQLGWKSTSTSNRPLDDVQL